MTETLSVGGVVTIEVVEVVDADTPITRDYVPAEKVQERTRTCSTIWSRSTASPRIRAR